MIFKNNKTYDALAWIALSLIPALVTLVLKVGEIWSLPDYDKVGMTIGAIGFFLGTLVKVSSIRYKKAQDEIAAGEALEEDGDQGEEDLYDDLTEC